MCLLALLAFQVAYGKMSGSVDASIMSAAVTASNLREERNSRLDGGLLLLSPWDRMSYTLASSYIAPV